MRDSVWSRHSKNDMKRARITKSHRICPHCSKELNIKTYKEHRRLYYDSSTSKWYVVEKTEPLIENDSSSSSDTSLFTTSPEMSEGDDGMDTEGGMLFATDELPTTSAPMNVHGTSSEDVVESQW